MQYWTGPFQNWELRDRPLSSLTRRLARFVVSLIQRLARFVDSSTSCTVCSFSVLFFWPNVLHGSFLVREARMSSCMRHRVRKAEFFKRCWESYRFALLEKKNKHGKDSSKSGKRDELYRVNTLTIGLRKSTWNNSYNAYVTDFGTSYFSQSKKKIWTRQLNEAFLPHHKIILNFGNLRILWILKQVHY